MKAAAPNSVTEEATEEKKMADGVHTDKSKVHFRRSELYFSILFGQNQLLRSVAEQIKSVFCFVFFNSDFDTDAAFVATSPV